MASGGGARAWRFLRRNPELQAAWEACVRERPAFEDAPFAIRRQSGAERVLGRFGLHAVEDPFAGDGPVSPFWAVAPMLDVVSVRAGGPGLAALAGEAGTALAGLRARVRGARPEARARRARANRDRARTLREWRVGRVDVIGSRKQKPFGRRQCSENREIVAQATRITTSPEMNPVTACARIAFGKI